MKKIIYFSLLILCVFQSKSQISLIGQGCDSSPNQPLNFISYKGNLYYNNAGCSDNPSGIYKTNGDALGTLVAGTNFVSINNYPERRGVSGKNILFGDNSGRFWKINGETGIAEMIKDNLGSVPTFITDLNGIALFSENGTNLWRSDGTEAGTYKIKDMEVWNIVSDGTYAYISDGYNIWRTDGTEAGTTIIVPLIRGEDGNSIYYSPSTSLTRWNNKVFFIFYGKYATSLNVIDENTNINLGVTGCHLDAGWSVCTGFDVAANSGGIYPTSSGIFFFGKNYTAPGQSANYELWKSDGTASGTIKVMSFPSDITPLMSIRANDFNSYPKQSYDDIFYFTASNPTHGIELWRSDGTAAGTFMVKDINAGSADSRPQGLGVIDGICYFSARTDDNGREIWKSDGTTAGTVLVQDLNPGVADGVISPEPPTENLNNRWATVYNGRYYFKGISPTAGGNLFAVDGLKHYVYRQILTPTVSTIDIAKKAIFIETGTLILPIINVFYEGKIQNSN